jgi:transaldolase / glucose-6-phosphate isomerase
MTTPIETLHALGQSLWYDNIQRKMLESGEFEEMIRRGELRGMTSNPSIFNQAIARSTDYDSALTPLAWSGYTSVQILDQLILEDIRAAAGLFMPLYKESGGKDGYVSVEVSPDLANDTDGTLAEARRLWELVDRPNAMIKIPATRAGLPAIRQAIADGINVNITLIFSINRYKAVIEAYLEGLEDRLKKGQSLDGIASVASFFISRIDSKIDKRLDEIVRMEGVHAGKAAALRGKLAVANAKMAYALFKEIFQSERFARLEKARARIQRPLWASTSAKDPAYSETKYVDELIGVDTVNTLPPQTMDAYREHGKPRLTVEENLEEARQALKNLENLGISMEQVTDELEEEGVRAFFDAYQALLQTVEERRETAVRQLGPLSAKVPERVRRFEEENVLSRLWEHDPSLWTEDEEGQREIRRRMGWLVLPEKSLELIEELQEFAAEIRDEGYTNALLLGMGGSSLSPEVLSRIFAPLRLGGQAGGGMDLSVLDSTNPTEVLSAATRSPLERTLFIASSKSGGTVEVSAFLDYFWETARERRGDRAGRNFIAITDPGTSLDKLARERGFRRVLLSDPDVGGRFSALTVFGLAPAALLGLDLRLLLERAGWMMRQSQAGVLPARVPGLILGAVLGEAAENGRDKLTLVADPALAPFGSWLEQLISESSGKGGRGIIPVDGEPLGDPGIYGDDRLFVHLGLKESPVSREQSQELVKIREAGHPVLTFLFQDPYDLGAEFYRWSLATAVACSVLKVNAFNQPDVQDNKDRTSAKLQEYSEQGRLDEGQPLWGGDWVTLYGGLTEVGFSPYPVVNTLEDFLTAFFEKGEAGDYIALNAYLERNAEMEAALEKMRNAVRRRTGLAVTVGFGPRFLHSTGQLHKGGPVKGHFLQITANPKQDVNIPTKGITFGVLERAQSIGDMEALQARSRPILRIHLSIPGDIHRLVEAVEKLTAAG